MLNIPETVKALYKADGVRKEFRVQFPNGELPDLTNDNIVQESVKFTESLCSQDVLKFGLTENSVIEFETVGAANMYGMTIKCSSEIDLSSLSADDLAEIADGSWDGEIASSHGDSYKTATGSPASFSDGVIAPAKNVTVSIPIVQSGSGDPSPSNVREIIGYTEASIRRTGKNLFNYPAWAGTGVQNGTAVYENNGVTLTATAGDCYTDFSPYPTAARIPVTEGVPVTLSWETDDAVHGNQIIFPNGDIPGLVTVDNYYSHSLTYTPGAGVTFVTIRFGVSNSGDVIHYKNVMVVYGSSASTFEPFHGSISVIDFPPAFETVCAGTLDVTAGLLTVTHKIVQNARAFAKLDFSTADVCVFAIGGTGADSGVQSPTSDTETTTFRCNRFKSCSVLEAVIASDKQIGISASTTSGYCLLTVPASYGSTVEDINTWLTNNPTDILCDLITPATLTVQAQTITTLQGQNIIHANAGPVTVQYYDTAVPSFRVPYGLFRVESCPRDHQAMAHRRVEAYSIAAAKKTIDLGTGLLWDSIQADPNALLAAAIGTGMTVAEVMPFHSVWFVPDQANLYDYAGNDFLLGLRDGGEALVCGSGNIFSNQSTDADDPCDFLRVDVSGINLAAHDAFGYSVANALSGVGMDLTYNASRKKIYANNAEALRRCQPWLFSPGIMYHVIDIGTADLKNVFCVWQPITNGNPVPTICPEEYANVYPCGFNIQNNRYKIAAANFYYLQNRSADSTISVVLNGIERATVQKQGIAQNFPKVERMKISTSAGFKVKIQNTGTIKRQFVKQAQISGTLQSTAMDSFDYLDIDLLGLAEGALEMFACFAKHSRAGGFEIVRLQASSPQAIPPGEYSQAWWDEFDVLPIGAVKYVITDADKNESVCIYQFSSNPSVYDMSDNALILSMGNPSQGTINSLLASLFVPNLAPIAFTPIDLDMKGLPYMEAGDYLAVTAEDGTVVYSFNMRQEIIGIQAMTATIESSSGQIIESGESV